MNRNSSIITVGLCPSWDTVCRFDGIEWGDHKTVSSADSWPAGKAMNISRALAWMGEKNIAAGLWGLDDFQQMAKTMRPLERLVNVKMTPAEGETRRNVTIVDTLNNREMHLRNRSELASKKALRKLEADLKAIVKKGNICVFAGMMPEDELMADVIRIIKSCRQRGAEIVVDTYGDALKRILATGAVRMIKPNVEESRELLGEKITDSPTALVRAGRKLLDKVEVVVISRGKKGGLIVTNKGAWNGRCMNSSKVLSTVGCGDYLLAGFLKGLKDKSNMTSVLTTAIKVATARAWGFCDKMSWHEAQRKIKVQVKQM